MNSPDLRQTITPENLRACHVIYERIVQQGRNISPDKILTKSALEQRDGVDYDYIVIKDTSLIVYGMYETNGTLLLAFNMYPVDVLGDVSERNLRVSVIPLLVDLSDVDPLSADVFIPDLPSPPICWVVMRDPDLLRNYEPVINAFRKNIAGRLK